MSLWPIKLSSFVVVFVVVFRLFFVILETVYFASKHRIKMIKSNMTIEKKKRFPQFLLCGYVCDYVCMYVCMYVCSLQPTLFDLESWNLDWRIKNRFPQNEIFLFLNFDFFGEILPFSQFLHFSLYYEYMSTDHNNQHIKLKLERKYIYSIVVLGFLYIDLL